MVGKLIVADSFIRSIIEASFYWLPLSGDSSSFGLIALGIRLSLT
jgi:hypothetical protein